MSQSPEFVSMFPSPQECRQAVAALAVLRKGWQEAVATNKEVAAAFAALLEDRSPKMRFLALHALRQRGRDLLV
jgi:hypothetical protein